MSEQNKTTSVSSSRAPAMTSPRHGMSLVMRYQGVSRRARAVPPTNAEDTV